MTIRNAIALTLAVLLCACASGQEKALYPVDETLTLAPRQRRDFVDSFLQGRWCEAESLYAASVDKSIRRDDFCQAAATARLAARLKAYIGQKDEAAEEASREYAQAALGCPEHDDMPASDRRYRNHIDEGRFDRLGRDLIQEEDALYASVYARKGAREALAQGQKSDALQLLETARRIDAAQGWVTFLREDWALRLQLTDNEEHRQAIRERIEILERRIEPCP